jgi:hypothetical protein
MVPDTCYGTKMIKQTKITEHRSTFTRLCTWIVLGAAIFGGLRWVGADVISCAFFVGWGALVAITCQYVSVKAGGIVSGSIAAACVGLAIVEHALHTHPVPPIGGAVVVIPIAFVIGYALPCAISVLVTRVGQWVGIAMNRGRRGIRGKGGAVPGQRPLTTGGKESDFLQNGRGSNGNKE